MRKAAMEAKRFLAKPSVIAAVGVIAEERRRSAIQAAAPKLLKAIDGAIEVLLHGYEDMVLSLEDWNALLFDLITASRRARGLRPPTELPEAWTTEEQETSGNAVEAP